MDFADIGRGTSGVQEKIALEALQAVTEINGAELVRRARAGDGAAWEDIVSGYTRRIFNLAYRFTSSVDAAEDLTQDVFIRIYRTLDQYDPKQGDLSNWLMRPRPQFDNR